MICGVTALLIFCAAAIALCGSATMARLIAEQSRKAENTARLVRLFMAVPRLTDRAPWGTGPRQSFTLLRPARLSNAPDILPQSRATYQRLSRLRELRGAVLRWRSFLRTAAAAKQ